MTIPSLSSLLRLNSAYSLTSGGLALVVRESVATALAVPVTVVALIGVGLLAFGLVVGWLATASRATAGVGAVIAGADAVWVLAVAAFIGVTQPPLSGLAVALAASVPVAALAALQFLAALRMARPGLRTVEVSQEVAGSAAELWPVMTDNELYAQLAPNLSRVELSTPEQGASDSWRRCWDVRGNHWDEMLQTWAPPHMYAVQVDTSASDYPYPLDELRGVWSVTDKQSGGSTVTMRFEFRPRSGFAGAAFAAVLSSTSPGMMRRILTGWQREVLARRTARGGSTSSIVDDH